MNGFQKEYWKQKEEVNRQLKKYHIASFMISTIINLLLFYGDGLDILFVKIVVLAMLIVGILGVTLSLPSFYIKEDKSNKTEVRVLMILAPLVLYGLLLFGWFG